MKKNITLIIILVLVTAIVIAGAVIFFIASKNMAPKEYSSFFSPGDAFVTNARDSTKMVKVTMKIEINEKKKEKFLEENMIVIQDIILAAIRSKTEEELRNVEINAELSSEICLKLNERFDVQFFKQVYFSEWVVQ